MTNSQFEVKIQFNDGQVLTISDRQLAKDAAVLVRAISNENVNWETESVILSYPLDVPFPYPAGRFVFDYIGRYTAPKKMQRPARLEDYEAADQLPLEELKDVLELANFLECLDFVDCIAFVIAQKLDSMDVNDIAGYLGVEVDSEQDLTNDGMGWPERPVD